MNKYDIKVKVLNKVAGVDLIMGNVFNWGRGTMSILWFKFHDEWVDDLDLLQYWKGKVRQLPIVYFHFHNNPTVLIDVDYMYLRILLGFNGFWWFILKKCVNAINIFRVRTFYFVRVWTPIVRLFSVLTFISWLTHNPDENSTGFR